MSSTVAVAKAILLYLIFFLPLARLRVQRFDPHIGNGTASRVSGLPLARICFRHSFGMVLPVLSLSLQYDRFRGDLKLYKLFHAALISFSGPLFYLFACLFTRNEEAALLAALLYAASFHFPVVGNWLIQPEHYEILFFLAGASLALWGLGSAGAPCLLAGAFLMGCSLLCKLPALPSVWIMLHLCLSLWPAGWERPFFMVGAYLAPYLCFAVGERMLPREDRVLPGGQEGRRGLVFLLRSTVSRYLSHYLSDPRAYLENFVYYHLKRYSLQFLPLLFLAAVFFTAGASSQKGAMWLGLAIVSLIMVIRMGFAYMYCFNIVLCLAAGWSVFALPRPQSLYWVVAVAALLAVVSALALREPVAATFGRASAGPTRMDMLAHYLKENLRPEQRWFCNINNSLATLYPLAERGFPGYFTILAMGGYGPRINHQAVSPAIAREGLALLGILWSSPPDYLVQSSGDWPILNLAAVERYCGLTYHVCAVIDPFTVYRLAGRRELVLEPDLVEMALLFDAERGLSSNNAAASAFVELVQRMERLSSLKEAAAAAWPEPRSGQVLGSTGRGESGAPAEASGRRAGIAHRVTSASAPSSPEDMNFCCLFLESPAPELVEAVYRRDPWLRSAPYQLQHDALLAAHLGASGHAPLLARQPGPQARHLIVNCPQLLQAWRGEQKDGPPHPDSLILEQVERLAPQVVCLCEPLLAGPELVMSLRRRVKLLAARHHGAAPPRLAPGYDLVLTPFPQQNISGTACYYSPLCHRGPLAGRFLPFEMRAIDVSFVGELWARHTGKQRFLEHLARTSPILFWGEGVELLPPGSPIHPRYRGPAKGDELTKILGYSRITVNRHADADRCAWNGRLFEATAAGTLLVTDYHDNLPELFEVGKEVVAYHSPAQCRELIDYYLRHPEEAEAVARAGQARTLRDHSYARRVGEAVALFRQHLSIMEAA